MVGAKVAGSAVALALAIFTAGIARGQSLSHAGTDTTGAVRKALARVPYYGVFDFLAFKVESGVVRLQGYAHRPALKDEAARAVRRATSLDVVNAIEVLPTASFDDRIRWDTYRRVYTEDFADKYVSGGSREIGYELFDMSRFPGMEPYGNYPVHIVVKNRRVTLIGAVANAFDKEALVVRARQAAETLGVDDLIMVRTRG